MKLQLLLLLAVLSQSHHCMAAHILAMFPLPANSHHFLFNAMVRTLVSRGGHHVVLYTPYPWTTTPLDNLTIVHLDNIVSMDVSTTKETLETYMSYSTVALTTPLLQTSGGLVDNVYQSQKVFDLIKSNEHFDLVLLEAFYSQEPFLALGKKFKAPIISIHPFGAYGIVNQAMGNPLNLAFIPDFESPVSDKMSFFERLTNAYSILRPMHYFYTEHLPAKTEIMRKLFDDPSLPSVEELFQDISLVFNNAHPNVHYIQPYAPNIIPIGGIHLQTQAKPVPAEIQKFLDEATEGVIYFSLGSVTPDEKLGEEYFTKFLNVFKLLRQRVLWKTNGILHDLPQNVMTTKWVSQQDVLAHPNVIVFMTHGGIFSQHEALYAGVPVVCIPLMCDQPMNAKFYEDKEIGVRLFYDTLSQDTISRALNSVISDPKYKDNMLRMSWIYRDRPVSPADTLLYWVDYVIRHDGAPHLRPAAAMMPFYQLNLLDVVGFFIITFVTIITVLYLVLKCFLGMFYSRVPLKVRKSKKHN